MNNTAAIAAIRAESARVGWPESWATDVDIDENWLSRLDDGVQFVWVLRIYGTHVLLPHAESVGLLETIKRGNEGAENPHHYYFWDGAKLHALPYESCARRLSELSARYARQRAAVLKDISELGYWVAYDLVAASGRPVNSVSEYVTAWRKYESNLARIPSATWYESHRRYAAALAADVAAVPLECLSL